MAASQRYNILPCDTTEATIPGAGHSEVYSFT
jgi:hypothetical protein